MAITHVTQSATIGMNGVTFVGVNTTGATLLVVSVSYYAGGGASPSVSDNKGNTWVGLTARVQTQTGVRLFYTAATSVGTGHDITITGSSIFASVTLLVIAGTGAAPFEAENGAGTAAAGPLATGSVTPAASGALIVSGWAGMNATSNPVVTGLTQITSHNPNSGVNLAGGFGYTIQTTPAAINPSWAWTGTDPVAVAVAVFKASVAAAPAGERVTTFVSPPR